MINRSLNGQEEVTRNPDLIKSIRSEKNGFKKDEDLKDAFDKREVHNWSQKSKSSIKNSEDGTKQKAEKEEQAYEDEQLEEEDNYEEQFE